MDDPKKKGSDAKRKSQQPHELAYQKRKAAKKKGAKKSALKKKAAKKKSASRRR